MQTNTCNICSNISCAAAHLDQKELNTLKTNSSQITIKKGEVIFKEHTKTSAIAYMQEGMAKVYMQTSPTKSKIIRIVKSPIYLGIIAAYGDKWNHYSIASLTKSRLCFIDISTFKSLVKTNGSFASEILKTISETEITNYHQFVNHAYKQSNGRVADALLFLMDNIYCSSVFSLDLSRSELASFIGISREGLTRILYEFQSEEIIILDRKRIKIINKEKLFNISKNG